MKKINMLLLAGALCLTTACGDDDRFDFSSIPTEPGGETPDNPDKPTDTNRDELYRPQIHYTPNANWINDPNGLVYADGTYHMFYQYNPSGNDWGNMSWGHATSTDLMHWKEQPVALTRDDLGDIFSGCCVVDKNSSRVTIYFLIVIFFFVNTQFCFKSALNRIDVG